MMLCWPLEFLTVFYHDTQLSSKQINECTFLRNLHEGAAIHRFSGTVGESAQGEKDVYQNAFYVIYLHTKFE